MTAVLPARLSSLRDGEILSYVSLCHVGVGEGNGGCIFQVRSCLRKLRIGMEKMVGQSTS